MRKNRLIVLKSANKLKEKLKKKFPIIPIEEIRFSNGEGKIKIKEEIKKEDVYILTDVGNYEETYSYYNTKNHYSPDDHFTDLKRTLTALSGYPNSKTVIMPLLYQSRQHKKKKYESTDCVLALKELESLGVNKIITCDVHDPSIANAIINIQFENLNPTDEILKVFLKREKPQNVLVISPDLGAKERAKNLAGKLHTDVGLFYKRRDLTKIVNGKNPIIEHTYLGQEVKGKDIIIIDDMIASGTSMLEVAKILKEKGAKRIYFITTFSLFTEGTKKFQEYHNKKIFTKLYTTNLSYIPKEIKKEKWIEEIDCSKLIEKAIQE